MIYFVFLLKSLAFCKKGTRYPMQRGWIVLWVYLSPLTAKGLATAHVDESFESNCVCCFLLAGTGDSAAPSRWERWPWGVTWVFCPLQGQGLSLTGRELVGLVYICSTVGLDICLFYGWCNGGWSLPPSAALCIEYHCYSPVGPSRRGNTSIAVPDHLK